MRAWRARRFLLLRRKRASLGLFWSMVNEHCERGFNSPKPGEARCDADSSQADLYRIQPLLIYHVRLRLDGHCCTCTL